MRRSHQPLVACRQRGEQGVAPLWVELAEDVVEQQQRRRARHRLDQPACASLSANAIVRCWPSEPNALANCPFSRRIRSSRCGPTLFAASAFHPRSTPPTPPGNPHRRPVDNPATAPPIHPPPADRPLRAARQRRQFGNEVAPQVREQRAGFQQRHVVRLHLAATDRHRFQQPIARTQRPFYARKLVLYSGSICPPRKSRYRRRTSPDPRTSSTSLFPKYTSRATRRYRPGRPAVPHRAATGALRGCSGIAFPPRHTVPARKSSPRSNRTSGPRLALRGDASRSTPPRPLG